MNRFKTVISKLKFSLNKVKFFSKCWLVGSLLFTITGLADSNTSTASTPSPTPPPNEIVTAINGLGDTLKNAESDIRALIIAAVNNFNNMMYQLDLSLPTALQANSQRSDIINNLQTNTTQATDTEVSKILRQLPEAIISTNQLKDPAMADEIQQRAQMVADLTTNIPASDTLYLDTAADPTAESDGVSKPSTLNDNYFNFETLFAPTAYNDNQKQAAQTYLIYTGQLYQSLLTNIDFDSLRQKLNSDNKLTNTNKANLLKDILSDPAFQKYQLDVRSIMATKSAALSSLNLLTTERTPVKELGTKTGLPNDPNLATGYASPLQVEEYIATHRLSDSSWYNQMQTASPAAVAREQVLILAEIEGLLYRNHLDNERMLALLAVTALSQQGEANTQTLLSTDAKIVDDLIKTKIQDADNDAGS